MVDVPALSLSSIREYFIGGGGGWKCIYPFVNNGDDDHVASKNSEEGLDGLRGKAMTKYNDIQTIRLRASDLMCDNTNNDNIKNNYYGSRCVHYSTNLLSAAADGEPSTVVRIIASPEDIEGASMLYITPEEDIMLDNDDYDISNCNSNILEIILPSLDSLSFNNADVDNSFLYSSRRRRRHDGGSREVIYYGGEQHGILSSSTTKTNDATNLVDFDKHYNEENDKKESYSYAAIEVHGAASVIIHDFLGIPGLEQCLILPRLFISSRTTTTTTTTLDWSKEEELLLTMIHNSVLTDGIGLLLFAEHMDHPSVKNTTTITTTENNNGGGSNRVVICKIASMELPPLLDEGSSLSQGSDNKKMKSITPSTKIMPKQQHDGVVDGNITTNEITSEKEDEQPTTTPAWVDAIERTVKHRLNQEAKELEQYAGSIEVGRNLINEGRRMIHSMYSRPQLAATSEENSAMGGGGGRGPEVVRLRYGVRPRMSDDIRSSSGSGIVATIDMEVDVIFRANGGGSSSKHHAILHDFHLSCTLLRDNSNSAMSVTTAMTNVRTLCGIVPTFRNGDCVTILASVFLSDLRVNVDEHNVQSSTVDISIQGIWTDDNSHTTYGTKATRRGTVLCILRVPTEILFLAPPIVTSPSRFGRWIQYEITFSNDDDGLTPSAIFEYLHPQTIIIDKSDNVQDMNMWKQFVLTMNADLGGNSFIDLYAAKGDPGLKLVVFGSNPEERAGKFHAVQFLQVF
jgi:hypothetical protein